MNDPYSILGVSREASDDEIKAAYRALVKKYHPDNYESDNPLGELANEKMQEINRAYDEIQRERASGGYTGSSTYYQSYNGQSGDAKAPVYAKIRADINGKRFLDAERELLAIPPEARIAEWHYLMSLILLKRNYTGDAMRELEIACSMEPGNYEYQKAKEMFNTHAGAYGSTYYGGAHRGRYRTRQDDACDCCANLICLDCLCECMGGDLLRCI